jgi:ribosome biogenesis GTPase A
MLNFLQEHYRDNILKYLGLLEDTSLTLTSLARAKGFLIADGEYDLQRAAVFLLAACSKGRLGRISLEVPTISCSY